MLLHGSRQLRLWLIFDVGQRKMKGSPASHYVDLYRFRVHNAVEGGSAPSPSLLAQARVLLAALEQIEPTTKVILEDAPGKTLFKESETGRVIGTLDCDI